jgi:hypothetical protein
MPASTATAIREQIETELRDIVRKRHHVWKSAGADQQQISRERFMNALKALNTLLLEAKSPGSREHAGTDPSRPV